MNPLGVRVGQYQHEAGTVGSPPARGTRLIAGAPVPPNERYDADIIILGLDRIEETLAAIASASGQTRRIGPYFRAGPGIMLTGARTSRAESAAPRRYHAAFHGTKSWRSGGPQPDLRPWSWHG